MIEQFVKGMKLLSEPDFRALLNQMVDALNFLLEKAEEQEAKVLEDDQEEEATSALYRVSAASVWVADRKWLYTLTPQRLKTTLPVPTSDTGSFWEDDPDGEVLTNAINILEDRNTAGATLQGNDLDFNAAPFGTTSGTLARKLQPIKSNRYVQVLGTIPIDSTTSRAYFSAANVAQEPCIA